MAKEPFEWEEEDIKRLIDNQIQESSNLEYKRCDALIEHGKQTRQKIIDEISKDVSSFANAEGGTIIYGVIEDKNLPKDIDGGFDPTIVRREWLEDVIDSNVKPKIEGLRIKQIVSQSKSPGKVIYVIYVPQSLQGAIQANDQRYYQRRNFKAEPMEDYQVRDVMNRFKHPLLKPEIDFESRTITSDLHEYGLLLKLANKGVITAKAFGMDMLFPKMYSPKMQPYLRYVSVYLPEKMFENYHAFKFRNVESQTGVLFPGEKWKVFGGGDFTYTVNDKNWEQSFLLKIYITTYADDMPPQKSEYSFSKFHNF